MANVFQSPIGTQKTFDLLDLENHNRDVSIPYRYTKNLYSHCFRMGWINSFNPL